MPLARNLFTKCKISLILAFIYLVVSCLFQPVVMITQNCDKNYLLRIPLH